MVEWPWLSLTAVERESNGGRIAVESYTCNRHFNGRTAFVLHVKIALWLRLTHHSCCRRILNISWTDKETKPQYRENHRPNDVAWYHKLPQSLTFNRSPPSSYSLERVPAKDAQNKLFQKFAKWGDRILGCKVSKWGLLVPDKLRNKTSVSEWPWRNLTGQCQFYSHCQALQL